MLEPGATVLIRSGPPQDPNRKHLYVVVGRQSGPPAMVLVVPVFTIKTRHYDTTMVLNQGEHSFIKHPSYIRYGDAKEKSERAIEEEIQHGSIVVKEDISEEMLERIRIGFNNSKFARPFAKQFLEESD